MSAWRKECLTAVLLLICCLAIPAGATKYALVVGINRYCHLPALDGPLNDATIMTDMLRGWYGVPDANLVTLTDDGATRAAIQRTMQRFIVQVTPADTVILHFSGHGTVVKVATTYHEAFVPYDGRAGDAASLITDTDLRAWLAKLKQPATYVVLDHCYAPGMTRPIGRGREVSVTQAGARMTTADTLPRGEHLSTFTPTARGGQCYLVASQSRTTVHDLTFSLSNGTRVKAGGLTYALYRCLYENPGYSTDELLAAAGEKLRTWGVPQQPGLRGLPPRGPIFGGPRAGIRPACLPVVTDAHGTFELLGGAALNLAKGTQVDCLDARGTLLHGRTVTKVNLWRSWVE